MSVIRTALYPARVRYLKEVLALLGIDPDGKRPLATGPRRGLFAEGLSRLGANVTGVDPSEPRWKQPGLTPTRPA